MFRLSVFLFYLPIFLILACTDVFIMALMCVVPVRPSRCVADCVSWCCGDVSKSVNTHADYLCMARNKAGRLQCLRWNGRFDEKTAISSVCVGRGML